MKRHSFEDYMLAVRSWSFPASVMPVIVTVCYMFWKQYEINWLVAVLCLGFMVLFHAAGNVWDDYFDNKKRGKTEETGVPALTLAACLMLVATALGILVCALAGWQLIWLGLAGILLALVYPWCKYHVLGDLNVFLTLGVLPVMGTTLAAGGWFDSQLFFVFDSWREAFAVILQEVLLFAVPLGLITVAIIHSDNTRDIAVDRIAGIHTLPTLVGHKASVVIYICEIIIPYIWIGVLSIIGILPMLTVFIFLTMPFACGLCYNMRKSLKLGTRRIKTLDAATARIQLFFSLALSLSMIISRFIAL